MIRILWMLAVGSFGYDSVNGQGQRVAPGVPPQQYQRVPQHHIPPSVQQPPQQFQQAPPYQQVPPQQHQIPQHVPIQQQQQQPPQHIPIPDASREHHAHDGQPQILNAANIAHEKEHIREHLDVPMDTSKMTDQELQFHYFKMHDADNNNKLDGCELIKSLIHWHEQGHTNKEDQVPTVGEKLFKDEELVALIDPILNMDDSNKDGFIDYPEFIQAQQKAAASGRP